jgi:hypothetical protein
MNQGALVLTVSASTTLAVPVTTEGVYAEGIRGCYFEFAAYNLLCVMLHSNNKRDLLSSMVRYYVVNTCILILNVSLWVISDIFVVSAYQKKPNKT